jgi:excisionase family DNA binding protein
MRAVKPKLRVLNRCETVKRNSIRESVGKQELFGNAPVDAGTDWEPNRLLRPVPVMPIPTQRLLGVSAAAQYLGISDDTLRKYADLGEIPAYRFINGHRAFKVEDLDRLIDSLPPWDDRRSDTARAGRNGGIA